MAADEGAQDTLRRQFKALQEMQHQRLQQQVEKRKERELSSRSKASDQKEALEVPDGFRLPHGGMPLAKGSFEKRVLEDEIAQLREQLRETVDENGRLYKLLKEREFEIKHLKKKIEEDRLAFTGTAGMAGDMVATKIVELSKRNRVLMAESEGAKTRVKQLEREVSIPPPPDQGSESGLPAQAATEAGARPLRSQQGDRAAPENPEVKALQDRLAATNLRMADLRNQVQAVKQELRVAQKVRDLEKQLGEARSQSAGTARDDLPAVHSDPRKLSAQEKHLLRLRVLEREKQESWEKLASERDALQRELEEQKKKAEAVRSRNKVLASEVKTLRSQMGTLVEKGRHDDELIDALMDQLKQLQEILGSLSLQEEQTRVSQHRRDQQLHSEAQQSSSLVAQLRAMVAEREAKVRQLELEVGQLSSQYLQNKGLGEAPSRPEVNHTPTKGSEERSLTRSPASVGDHTTRLGSSRSVTSLGHTLVESARTRPSLPSPLGASPRLSDSPEQKSWQAQAAEFKALWQAAEVERDRLAEFVTVLQKRKVTEVPSAQEDSQLLKCPVNSLGGRRRRSRQGNPGGHRRRLPQSDAAPAGAWASTAKNSPNASSRKDEASGQLSDMPMESQVEELTTRLTIQVEENELLKAALGSALRGKEEDFRMYHETLDQVKGVFLQALRQQKANRH
ncbi:coiled-coil domain-containing protein 13 [Echinops telfairi]|uniref:Coiled-coil domain-containing protein 13 n=1 Tax=Echinops telfairi TaxID=9371 RepID=A0AC55DGQ3_ECHTE|nr:coiled-coil domain-containing protein 13 [Echinops telfairi]